MNFLFGFVFVLRSEARKHQWFQLAKKKSPDFSDPCRQDVTPVLTPVYIIQSSKPAVLSPCAVARWRAIRCGPIGLRKNSSTRVQHMTLKRFKKKKENLHLSFFNFCNTT